ncbi:uncharacterized protein V6R79_017392 [Siganus canaliculatus]
MDTLLRLCFALLAVIGVTGEVDPAGVPTGNASGPTADLDNEYAVYVVLIILLVTVSLGLLMLIGLAGGLVSSHNQ